MILTYEDKIFNKYIRRQIKKYKQKKAAIVVSDKPIKGVKWHLLLHPFFDVPTPYKKYFVRTYI